jgi:thiamine biosynthesis lipoprotein
MTLGENPEETPWNIGIQNPDARRGDSVGYVAVTDKTIVTSGIYERYFEANNVHYHHMLNPYDGYPFKNDLASVTIITNKSIIADAFSTSVFAMGIEKGLAYVTNQKDMEAIFITTKNEVYITPGLKDIIKITNMDFNLKN